MTDLSTEEINKKSPYNVVRYSVAVLRFLTDNSLVYEAGFTEDYTFLEEIIEAFKSFKQMVKDKYPDVIINNE